jgi:hypothetical protein
MIRKSMLSMLMLVGLLAGHLALASPASAAVEECAQGPTQYPGVTLISCIYVDGSNGRATTTVRWNTASPDTVIRPVATIQRSGSSATNNDCGWKAIGPGTSGSVTCNAYLPNPSGAQWWRSDAAVYIYLADSNPDRLSSPGVGS